MIATSPGRPEVDSGSISEPEQAVSKHSNAHSEISLAILGVNIVIRVGACQSPRLRQDGIIDGVEVEEVRVPIYFSSTGPT